MIYISLKRYCSTQGKSKLLLKTGIPLSEVIVVVVVVVVVVVGNGRRWSPGSHV